MSQPQLNYNYADPAAVQGGTSGLAIAALVCGLASLLIGPLGIVAAILGIIALTKRGGGNNKAFGITGIVTGVVGMLLGIVVLLGLILVPALSRARGAALQIRCSSNMRQIGQAILLYTNNNQGNYPPDLKTLATSLKSDLKPDAFVDTATADTPSTAADWPSEIVPGSGHLSYTYRGAGLTDSTALPDTIVLTEPLSDHEIGANVLFGDGHVDFIKKNDYLRLVPGGK